MKRYFFSDAPEAVPILQLNHLVITSRSPASALSRLDFDAYGSGLVDDRSTQPFQ
jgi:hypothetical protein